MFELNVGQDLPWKSPEEVGQEMRKYVALGPDFVKIGASGDGKLVNSEIGQDAVLRFSPEQLREMAKAVHDAGKIIQAHTTSAEALRIVVESGFDMTQHCAFTGPVPMYEATIKLMLDRKFYCVGSAGLPAEPLPARSSVTTIEVHGVESIPDADRDASVLDFVGLCWGGANSIATAVLGAFPIMFGLSFWQATVAAVLGLVVGSIVLAPMSIFGPINGTNNAVSSSAHFGVVGRIVGSFLSLLTAIAFFAISVWSSGDAVIGAARVVVHIHGTETQFAIIYGVFAVSVLVVCIYGFKMMLFINKIAVVASTILSSVAALLTVNIPGHFVGWLGNLAGGIDVSLVIALILPALLYPACLFLFPEPRAIYGPDGPRVVPAPDLPLAPIRGSGESDSISSGIKTR